MLHFKSSKPLQKININFYNDLTFNSHSWVEKITLHWYSFSGIMGKQGVPGCSSLYFFHAKSYVIYTDCHIQGENMQVHMETCIAETQQHKATYSMFLLNFIKHASWIAKMKWFDLFEGCLVILPLLTNFCFHLLSHLTPKSETTHSLTGRLLTHET